MDGIMIEDLKKNTGNFDAVQKGNKEYNVHDCNLMKDVGNEMTQVEQSIANDVINDELHTTFKELHKVNNKLEQLVSKINGRFDIYYNIDKYITKKQMEIVDEIISIVKIYDGERYEVTKRVISQIQKKILSLYSAQDDNVFLPPIKFIVTQYVKYRKYDTFNKNTNLKYNVHKIFEGLLKSGKISVAKICILKGCKNQHHSEKPFVNDMCPSCYEMITTGKVSMDNMTFVNDLYEKLNLVSKNSWLKENTNNRFQKEVSKRINV